MRTYLPYKYEIRWRLEYLNKRVSYGMWTNPADEKDVSNQASAQDRTGLIYACIEVKNFSNRRSKVIVRCPMADYIQHRWIAFSPSPTISLEGAVVLPKVIQGMTLVTRDEKVHVFVDGTIKREPMRELRNNYG